MVLRLIVVMLASLLFGSCTNDVALQNVSRYDFPVVDEEVRLGSGDTVYAVCEEVSTGKRVYRESSCGIDSCEIAVFGADGELIEDGMIGMVPNRHEFVLQIGNCVRTTEEYFSSITQ